MHGPHDQDPLSDELAPQTGATCVLCGEALGEDAQDVTMEDGSIVSLCRQCAGDELADQARVVSSQSLDDEDVTAAGSARALILQIIERRANEHSILESLSGIVDDLQSQLAAAQLSAFEQEERVRSLTSELDRMQERLRRAEELPIALGGRAGGPTTQESASLASKETIQQMVFTGAELTSNDVYTVQRVFNDSVHIEKMRSVRRSLGRPLVNIAKVAAPDPRALLTVAWDIVWYQYFVGLSGDPEVPEITLFAEGMELSELPDQLKEANATIDDHGRLDASELALSLEHDHPANEANVDDAEDRRLEDATEEIWGNTSLPEFRWDD